MNIKDSTPTCFGASVSPFGGKKLSILKQIANDKLLIAKLFNLYYLQWIIYKCCKLYIIDINDGANKNWRRYRLSLAIYFKTGILCPSKLVPL